tara:strand:- start:1321 stop:2019 length:699 start_codon:yes stop_codon:yes gene_type:complete
MRTADIREVFGELLYAEDFTIDRTGAKTIEIIAASFVADKPSIIGQPNDDYIKAEIAWYENQSTNIKDIYPAKRNPPEAWVKTANEHGEINSNYGHLIWSEKYCLQYERALDELLSNPDTRRASMIYTRPSIWQEYGENGKNDFICTNSVTYYVRDKKLHAVVQMRSNDVVYGYKNDWAWQAHVQSKLIEDYNRCTSEFGDEGFLTSGDIHWQVQNLHVYERHFELLEAYTS